MADTFSNLAPTSTWLKTSWVPLALLVYPLIVAILRNRRIRALESCFGYKSRAALAKMTDIEAREILSTMSELEFPTMFERGLQMALLRTYGIPSIAKLLVNTRELSSDKNVGKRYADTTVFIVEIYASDPNSERSFTAFSRLNYLHGYYRRRGKISNDDMLYTLSLFMAEPVRWINKYDWRTLTDLEVTAMATFHKSMGDAMEISYSVLPSAKTGFPDGLTFFKELSEWGEMYEAKFMLPDEANHVLALQTQKVLVAKLPQFAHSVLKKVVSASMDDRLRRALKLDRPPQSYIDNVERFMALRKVFLKHLSLPRPNFLRSRLLNDGVDDQGRRTFRIYSTMPYYVKPTWVNRYLTIQAVMAMIYGLPRPGDAEFCPEGYNSADTGPNFFSGKGKAEAEETMERLRKERTGGCPFAMLR